MAGKSAWCVKDGEVRHLQVFRNEVLWEGQLHEERLYLDITDHKNAEQALQATEENFRNSIENSPIGIRIVNEDGETLYINRALLHLYGHKNLEEFKTTPAISRYTPKSYLEFNERKEKRRRREPLPNEYEVSIVCKDGTVRHLQVFRKAVLWGGKRQYQALYMDITEHKQMVTRINDLNEILQLITNINQLIVQIDNESELLQKACEQFIESRQYRLAWIGFKQEDSYDILPSAMSGEDMSYLSSVRITWDDSPLGQGPTGTSIKTGKPCVIRDILHDPRFEPWRDAALSRGFKSLVALPLVIEDKVIGALTIYSLFTDAFDRKELDLLTELAGDLSLGIEKIRRREEHALIEQALRQERDRAQAYLDVADVMIIVWDSEEKVILVNRRGCEILGYKASEIIGRTWHAHFLPEQMRKDAAEYFRRVVGDEIEPIRQYENQVVTKDGQERTIAWNSIELRDGKGKIIGLLSSGEDITERKKSEAALKLSEQNFRNSLDSSSMGINIVNADGHILYLNQGLLDIFGYANIEEVRASPLLEHYTPASYANWLSRKEKQLRGEPVPDKIDVDIVRKDGTIRHIQAFRREVFWDGKQRYQTIYNDITERVQAEEALKEKETRYRELVNTITSGVIIYKPVDNGEDFVFVDINSAAEKLDGINRKDIIGKKITELLPGAKDFYLFKQFQKVWQTGNSEFYSSSFHKDESERSIWRDNWTYKLPGGEIVNVYNDITERKHAEEALKTSEQNFRNSMDSSILGIRISDNDNHTAYSNQALFDIFGYENADEVNAFPPSERYTPESYADFLGRQQRLLRGEPMPESVEVNIARKDGTVRHLQVFHKKVFWDGKSQYQTLYNDITARKQAEETLKASEQNFSNSLDSSLLGIYIADMEWHILYVNQAFLDIFGYANIEEVRTSPPSEHYTAEEYARYLVREKRIKRGETNPDKFEMEIIRKDGQVRHLQVFRREVLWNNQKEFMLSYHDITELKQAEAALKESEEKYRLIVENSRDLIFTLNTKGEFIYLSPSVKNLLGYNQTELIGKPFRSLVHPDDLPIIEEAISRTDVDGNQTTGNKEYRFRHASGEWRWHVSGGTATQGKGDISFDFIGIARDITEFKQTEQEKQRLEEKAQVASRLAAMGEMAAGIAHEINNPLTGVLGYSQIMLERENVPEDIKGDLRLITDSSQRVAEIVKRLLTFARQAKPVKSLVNLNELIDNTIKLRSYVLKTADIKVFTRFDRDLPLSVVDPGQLQQVFLNLIVNAEQAMKEAHGKGTLVIITEKQDNNIRISFQDDGPGITEENQAHMFEPFFTTKAPGEGTGLGLSLSRSIILEHDGNMSVESEPGHGATFIIELPITEILPSVTDASNQTAKVNPAATKKGKILVVDDESVVRGVLHRVLTRMGHSVDTFDDARNAMNKIDTGAGYDVILTDVRMPGMSGIEMYTRIIEKMPAMKNRIIFITGDVMGADIKNFLTQNNLAYLAKPFDIETLKEKINVVLSGGQS